MKIIRKRQPNCYFDDCEFRAVASRSRDKISPCFFCTFCESEKTAPPALYGQEMGVIFGTYDGGGRKGQAKMIDVCLKVEREEEATND